MLHDEIIIILLHTRFNETKKVLLDDIKFISIALIYFSWLSQGMRRGVGPVMSTFLVL